MKVAGMNKDEERFRASCLELDYVKAFLDGIRLGDKEGNSTVSTCWQIVNNAQHCLNTATNLARQADEARDSAD